MYIILADFLPLHDIGTAFLLTHHPTGRALLVYFRLYVSFNFALLIMLDYWFCLTLCCLSCLLPHMLLWGKICQLIDSSEYTCLPSSINMFIQCLTSKTCHAMAHDPEWTCPHL